MSTQAFSTRVPCTYKECSGVFESAGEMKRHKANEHDYCSRCDEDFQDDEYLLLHKIKSDKHIVCVVCGIDFRSEGGRDLHTRQQHRTPQTLTCYGCGQKFKMAGAMVNHVESGDCPNIPLSSLLQEQSKRLLFREALRTGNEGENAEPDGQDDNGGVHIDQDLLEMDPDDEATQSVVGGVSGLSLDDNVPEPKSKSSMASPSLVSETREQSASAGKIARPTSPRPGPSNSFGIDHIDAGHTLRALDRNWDPTVYFSSFNGKFICPCKAEFSSMRDFEEHVVTKTNQNRGIQCPGCLRIFRTAAALVAHCESASTRCKVNRGLQFSQVINDISGGLVRSVGLFADGSVEYGPGTMGPKQVTYEKEQRTLMD
ncbi:putative C2H2 finger domain protein [Aspergillus tubingensis]|uniref:putative C2H2 finger domain protein n=1 Tax=Aspergillus tubingensis TaxID=5068 RepID=UPI00157846DA|nr:C2H2 finger domain protein [Aspergillus tubingensis]GFN12674.1 C2H2 finger domain protein [Aspergillus tubingensis]GLB19626.1 hypothetical protein AtubIFM61612_009539 [Aspergillus tubingensis]